MPAHCNVLEANGAENDIVHVFGCDTARQANNIMLLPIKMLSPCRKSKGLRIKMLSTRAMTLLVSDCNGNAASMLVAELQVFMARKAAFREAVQTRACFAS